MNELSGRVDLRTWVVTAVFQSREQSETESPLPDDPAWATFGRLLGGAVTVGLDSYRIDFSMTFLSSDEAAEQLATLRILLDDMLELAVPQAAGEAGVPRWPLVSVQMSDPQRSINRTDLRSQSIPREAVPVLDALIGVEGAARMFAKTPEQIRNGYRHPAWPVPVAYVAETPLWTNGQLLEFLRRRGRDLPSLRTHED